MSALEKLTRKCHDRFESEILGYSCSVECTYYVVPAEKRGTYAPPVKLEVELVSIVARRYDSSQTRELELINFLSQEDILNIEKSIEKRLSYGPDED